MCFDIPPRKLYTPFFLSHILFLYKKKSSITPRPDSANFQYILHAIPSDPCIVEIIPQLGSVTSGTWQYYLTEFIFLKTE